MMEATAIAWWKWKDDGCDKQACKLKTEWSLVVVVVVRSWLKQFSSHLKAWITESQRQDLNDKMSILIKSPLCLCSLVFVLLWCSFYILCLLSTGSHEANEIFNILSDLRMKLSLHLLNHLVIASRKTKKPKEKLKEVFESCQTSQSPVWPTALWVNIGCY